MNNILRNIKLAFSAKARNELVNSVIAQDARLDRIQSQKEQVVHSKQYTAVTETTETFPGFISTDDLSDLNSEYIKNAIASLGAWSAIARAYNEFIKNPKSNTITDLFNEFHAWNAIAVKQMNEDDVLAVVARLTVVKPAKGSKETDAIIARVRKCTIADVQAKREADAELRTAQREAALENFLSALWQHIFSDKVFQIQAQKVVAKVVQTMEWIANWDSSNPAAQAAELLLAESDLNLIKQIAARDRGNTEDFVDGVMCADILSKRYLTA